MTYAPPYKITPKIVDLISKISEAIGSFSGQEDLRLHRANRIKTIQGTLILSKWRSIFKNLPVENIVYKYRKEYYRAIAVSGGDAGCTPFIEFILGVIDETLAINLRT